jgi:hypothetical protein
MIIWTCDKPGLHKGAIDGELMATIVRSEDLGRIGYLVKDHQGYIVEAFDHIERAKDYVELNFNT